MGIVFPSCAYDEALKIAGCERRLGVLKFV